MSASAAHSDIIDNYLKWLSSEFETTPSDRGCLLMTPFELPDGTGITLEIETLTSGNLRISDMGTTLGYLFANGLTLDQSMMDRIRSISIRHGASLESAALVIKTEPKSAGKAIHWLIHSVIVATDLIQMRGAYAETSEAKFDNEVTAFIIRSGVTYDADYQVKGTREKHNFRFRIDSDRNLLIQPLTASTESDALNLAERWAYHFKDTVQSEENWYPVAVLDDNNGAEIWTPHALGPILEYAILWSQKDKLAQLLAGSNL